MLLLLLLVIYYYVIKYYKNDGGDKHSLNTTDDHNIIITAFGDHHAAALMRRFFVAFCSARGAPICGGSYCCGGEFSLFSFFNSSARPTIIHRGGTRRGVFQGSAEGAARETCRYIERALIRWRRGRGQRRERALLFVFTRPTRIFIIIYHRVPGRPGATENQTRWGRTKKEKRNFFFLSIHTHYIQVCVCVCFYACSCVVYRMRVDTYVWKTIFILLCIKREREREEGTRLPRRRDACACLYDIGGRSGRRESVCFERVFNNIINDKR